MSGPLALNGWVEFPLDRGDRPAVGRGKASVNTFALRPRSAGLWDNTKGPVTIRNRLAHQLAVPVRVSRTTQPDRGPGYVTPGGLEVTD